jgi:hypothetical protein
MVQPVNNSAAGLPHPDDPTLKIPLVQVVANSGMPTSGGSHAYGNANGLLVTDTWTINGAVYVKTYTYTNGILTGESDWVKQ